MPYPARAHKADHSPTFPPGTPTQGMMKLLGLVDAAQDEDFNKFTRLVSHALQVPVALVSFVQEDLDRQYFKSEIGLTGHWAETRQTPLSHSFCQIVKKDNRPLAIENAPKDSRVCNNLAVPELGVRAYLGVPIHWPDGSALGALCAIDGMPRKWSPAQINLMVNLAACVSDQINLRALLHQPSAFGSPNDVSTSLASGATRECQ